MTGAAVALTDVTVAYDRHPALHHVSLGFEPGSLTAIVGPNGAGKSTLLKTIAGLLRPAAGRLVSTAAADRLAYLPQQAEIEREFPIRVGDAVLLGRWRGLGWHRAARRTDLEAVEAALKQVGLADFERRPVETLSSGQFQRVLFARLMLRDADLILLDEPFTAIDSATTDDLLALVDTWHREGRTVIAVLHDLAQVRTHFPHAVLLARDPIACGPTDAVLTEHNLAQARRMAEAWDEDAELCRQNTDPA